LLIIVVAMLAVALGLFAWRWEQRGPGRASIGGAIGRFRSSTTIAPTAEVLQPPGGVYVYTGSGSESLSFMSTRQTQGPHEPGTVTVLPNGCWQFRIEYNSFHAQAWNRCSTGGKLVERGGMTDQRFDFVAFQQHEHSDVTCDPPVTLADLTAAPGASWPVHCVGHSQTTKATMMQDGTSTFVGFEDVVIAGRPVRAIHNVEVLHVSGEQHGDVHQELWLDASNGLPLKEWHDVRVVSPAPKPINEVTYTEHGSWVVSSLTPHT
jgi:hypothetical protein